MNTEEKYNLIEKYLGQKMSAEEREKFEAEIENDPVLKQELKLHQEVSTTLKGEKIHEFRSVLAEVDQNWGPKKNEEKGKVRGINFRRVLAIAATVLLLVVSYLVLFTGRESLSSDQLFADNFQPYQMLLSQRNISAEEKNLLLESAIAAYSNGNFQNASSTFEQLLQSEPENISYKFYRAVSAIGANDNDTAIQLLNDIIAASDHPFTEQSQWYLGLAYLQKGDMKKASTVFNEIGAGQYKYEAAKQVLKN